MLSTTNHPRKAKQNHGEISCHLRKNDSHQKDKKRKTNRKDAERQLAHTSRISKAITKGSMDVPQEIKQPNDAFITLTGVQPMDVKLGCQKRHPHSHAHCNKNPIAKLQKQPKRPLTNGWTRKTWCTYSVEYHVTVRVKACHFQQRGWACRTSR